MEKHTRNKNSFIVEEELVITGNISNKINELQKKLFVNIDIRRREYNKAIEIIKYTKQHNEILKNEDITKSEVIQFIHGLIDNLHITLKREGKIE